MRLKKYIVLLLLLVVCVTSFAQTTNGWKEVTIQNITFNSGESFVGKNKNVACYIGYNISYFPPGAVILKKGSSVFVDMGSLEMDSCVYIEKGANFELDEFSFPVGNEPISKSFEVYEDQKIYYGIKHEGFVINDDFLIGNNLGQHTISVQYGDFRIGASYSLSNTNLSINYSNGNIGVGSNSSPLYKLCVSGDFQGARFLTTSDVRLKSKIKPLHNCNNKLLRLSGKTYNKKIDGKNESKEIGLIAQDVTDVLPDVVSKDQSGFLSVDYLSLVPLIIEAIKEQQETIDDNQKKLDEISF